MLQIFLQICVVLTGNFNFVNLLIVTLTISLLDDQFFYGKRRGSDNSWALVGKIINFLVYGAVLYAVITFYSIKIDGTKIDAQISKCTIIKL